MKIRGRSLSEEAKYRSLFENVREGIYQSTPDGKIITANPALVRMLGYKSEEELMSLHIARDLYVNPDDRDRLLGELVESDADGDIELRLRRKDGTEIFVLEHSHPVRDDQGEVLYFEGALTDITRRKAAETALRESEAKYQTCVRLTIEKQARLFPIVNRKSLSTFAANPGIECENPGGSRRRRCPSTPR